MAAALSDQLRPLLEAWAEAVAQEAAEAVFDATQALCPVAPEGGGETRDSGRLQQVGPTSWEITYDDRGFTDEGPTAHTIEGNPLLAFDWPEMGLFPAVFARVEWTPGPGVEENRGWFSERAATQENWEAELLRAADFVAF